MLDALKIATKLAKQKFTRFSISLQAKTTINQLGIEIDALIDEGEWDFAVRLGYYRHEFAKSLGSTDWYQPYIEIRNVRDNLEALNFEH